MTGTRWTKVYILRVAARAAAAVFALYAAANVSAFVPKPVNPYLLLHHLEHALEHRGMHRELDRRVQEIKSTAGLNARVLNERATWLKKVSLAEQRLERVREAAVLASAPETSAEMSRAFLGMLREAVGMERIVPGANAGWVSAPSFRGDQAFLGD